MAAFYFGDLMEGSVCGGVTSSGFLRFIKQEEFR